MAFAGSNKDLYPTLQNTAVDIGSSTAFLTPNGQRVYLNEEAGNFPGDIPAWPALSDSSARAAVSIRPPLWELLQGNQDTQLQAFLQGAPTSGGVSLVGLWHEASSQGPNGAYEPYFSSLDSQFPNQHGAKGLLTQAQQYVQKKAQLWNPNVKVGAIEVTEDAKLSNLQPKLDGWMAGDLDFYACDTYDYSTADADPISLLGTFQQFCAGLATNPVIGVTETNSRFPGRRPYWFTAAWSWIVSYPHTSDATSFLSFWRQDGKESGGWIADDWATIDALYAIFKASSP